MQSVSPIQQTLIKITTLLVFGISREMPELKPNATVNNAEGMHGRLSQHEDEMINRYGWSSLESGSLQLHAELLSFISEELQIVYWLNDGAVL